MKKLAAIYLILILLLSGCAVVVTSTDGTDNTSTFSEPTTIATIATTTTTLPETTAIVGEATTVQTSELTTQTQSPATSTPSSPTVKPTVLPTVTSAPAPGTQQITSTMKRDLLVMMLAYPDNVSGVELQDGQVYLVMSTGNRLLYDDGLAKSVDDKYTNADIQDMLEVLYPLETVDTLMPADVDPGRYRCYAFLNELYGSSKSAISNNLVTINWGTQKLPFNKMAGAATALRAISEQAALLAADHPEAASALYPSSGTFNYRTIAGTDRLSPHAYAFAIDINSTDGGYWRWMDAASGARLLAEYPQDVVRIFEKNNFIWGGKWNHFDLFHFEYRPEIILKARYFSTEPDPAEPWYQGADLGGANVQRCIDKIEAVLGLLS